MKPRWSWKRQETGSRGRDPDPGRAPERGTERDQTQRTREAGPRQPGQQPETVPGGGARARGKTAEKPAPEPGSPGARATPPPLTSGRGSWLEPGRPPARRVRDQSGREGAGGEWQEPGGVSELPRGWPERGSTEGRQGTESWRHDPRDRDADAERDAEAGETRSQRYRDHRRPRETQRSRCEDTWKECERDRDADRRRDKKAVTVDLERKKAGSREQKQRARKRKGKKSNWALELKGRRTSPLPRGGLRGPPGQGSQRRVLSQGHACGGAGRGRREGCGQPEPQAGRMGV